MAKVRRIGRSAKTGKFMSVKQARRRKNTAVVETMRRSKKRSR